MAMIRHEEMPMIIIIQKFASFRNNWYRFNFLLDFDTKKWQSGMYAFLENIGSSLELVTFGNV